MSYYSYSGESDQENDFVYNDPNISAGIPPLGSSYNMYQSPQSNPAIGLSPYTYQNGNNNNYPVYPTYNSYGSSYYNQPFSYINQANNEPLQVTAPPNISTKSKFPSLTVSNTQPLYEHSHLNLNTNNSNPANPSQAKLNPSLNYYGFNTSLTTNNNFNKSSTTSQSGKAPTNLSNYMQCPLITPPLSLQDWTKKNNDSKTIYTQSKNQLNTLPIKNQINLLSQKLDEEVQKMQNLEKKQANLFIEHKIPIKQSHFQPKKKWSIFNNSKNNKSNLKNKNVKSSVNQNTKQSVAKSLDSQPDSWPSSIDKSLQKSGKSNSNSLKSKSKQSLNNSNSNSSLKIIKKTKIVNTKQQEVILLPNQQQCQKNNFNENTHQQQCIPIFFQQQKAIKSKKISQNQLNNKVIKKQKKSEKNQSQNQNLLEIIKNLSEALNKSSQNLTLALMGKLNQKQQNKLIENIYEKEIHQNKNNTLQTEEVYILSSDGYKISLLVGFDISSNFKISQENSQQKNQDMNKSNETPISFIIITEIERINAQTNIIHKGIQIGYKPAFQLILTHYKNKNHEWLIQSLSEVGYFFIYSANTSPKLNKTSQNVLLVVQEQQKSQKDKNLNDSKKQKLQNQIVKKVREVLKWRSICSKTKKQLQQVYQKQSGQQIWISLQLSFQDLSNILQLEILKNE